MVRPLNRHQFAYPAGVNNSEPRYGFWDLDDPTTKAKVQAMVHPAVAAEMGQADRPVTREQAMRDLPVVEAMAAAERGEMAYDHGGSAGATAATPIIDRAQGFLDARANEKVARPQAVNDAYQYGQQYLNNPLDAKGRARMGRQFWEAPLGGHVRRGLEGQEVLGHRITNEQARMAEQGLAGLTAVGIGVPTFLAAVQQLSTPPDQNTIPF